MKRINFKEIEVEVSIGEFKKEDLSKEIGNILFKLANTLEIDKLARLIHGSESEIDIEDFEFEQMMQMLTGMNLYYRVRMALENAAFSINPQKAGE